MTSSVLLTVVLAVVVLPLVLTMIHWSRRSQRKRAFDAGSVSTRWLSELRRDEPWTGR